MIDIDDYSLHDMIYNIFITYYPDIQKINEELLSFYNKYIDYFKFIKVEILEYIFKTDAYIRVSIKGVEKKILYRDIDSIIPIGSIESYNRFCYINTIIGE